MTRDLYISTYPPILGSGRALRTYTCVQALAMLGPLDLAYVPLDGQGPSPEYAAIEGLEFHLIHPSRRLRRAATYLSMRARAIPPIFARGVSPELIREAERLASARERGRVIVGDLSVAAALLSFARRRPIIYNAHNVGPMHRDPGEPVNRRAQRIFTAFERRVLARAAESWMVSRRDMRAAADLLPGARLRYVPNAVDVARIKPVTPTPRPRRRLLMVGDFLYGPNRTGRAWLVDDILPLIWREISDVHLTVVGRGCEDWASPDPRVEVAGFVEDLNGIYAQADCVVVPVTSGGGSPLKFVEALAYQVPVVATPFAARGLEVVAGRHYLQGNDTRSFAAAILDVLRSGAVEVAAEGRRIAEEEYSVQSLAKRIAA